LTPLDPPPSVRPRASVKQQKQFRLGTTATKLEIASVRCGSAACNFQKPKKVAVKLGERKLWLPVTGPKRANADEIAKFGVRITGKAAKQLAGRKGRVRFKVRVSSDSGQRTITINKLLVGGSR
jgi:hypothetical protein